MRYYRQTLRQRIIGGPSKNLLAFNLGDYLTSRKNPPTSLLGYPSPLRAALGALFGSAFTSPGPSSTSSSDAFYTYTAPSSAAATPAAATAVVAATPGPAEYPSVTTLTPTSATTAQDTSAPTYQVVNAPNIPANLQGNALPLTYQGTPQYQDFQGPPDWSGPKARVRRQAQTGNDWWLLLIAAAAGYALYKSK
jgi:hypothetical protein